MTTLYLIRHGEAEGNLYRRAQGQYDSNITGLGRRQIAALAERFRAVPIDALWSSDLTRARSTAAAILCFHPALALHTSARLREIDVGVWEDMPWGNIHERYPEQLWLFDHDPARWHIEGGEPFEALAERMERALLTLAARYRDKTVAVVTHGLAVRALLCRLMNVRSEDIEQVPYGDNTSVALLTADGGGLRVESFNDASHLAGGLSTFSRRARQKSGAPGDKIYTHFEPLDPRTEGELYTRCYAGTWRASHGNTDGFAPAVYLRIAEGYVRRDPRCVMKLFQGRELAGVVALDPDRGREEGAGWISLVYIEPSLRGRRLGAQLVGHGVSYFRRQGRRALRLNVSVTNDTAIGFYKRLGFTAAGRTEGVGGELYLMEKDISRRVLTPDEILAAEVNSAGQIDRSLSKSLFFDELK